MSASAKTNRSPMYGVKLWGGYINDDLIRTQSRAGALPVLVSDSSPKFKQHSGYVTVSVDLPSDPLRAFTALYTVQVTPGAATAAFPTGSSPLIRGTSGVFNAHTPQGSTCDCWVVCQDKFFNPSAPTGANAFYAGRFTNAAGVVSSGVNV